MNPGSRPGPLSGPERDRYDRHMILPEIGPEGQLKLRGASVLVVGAGGLGSPLLQYLAAAGVGRIGIADDGTVELSNLHRQVIFSAADVGKPKAEEAARRVREHNPHVETRAYTSRVRAGNVLDVLGPYDVIADATDNFSSRYLLNDACRIARKPLVHGSLYRFEGQVTVFRHPAPPCYRCLFPEPPPAGLAPDCSGAGVLGALPGIIGSLQAVEVLRLIVGFGKPLAGRLVMFDALTMTFGETAFRPDPSCPTCAAGEPGPVLRDDAEYCGAGEGPVLTDDAEISPAELRLAIEQGRGILILDVRGEGEFALSNIGGKHIPLWELPSRLGEVSTDAEIVVCCRTGMRSARAVGILRRAGYRGVKHLTGGIEGWLRERQTAVPAG